MGGTAFPEPYLLTETENTIVDDILELLNKHGPTSYQSQNLLERLGRIIEMGQRVAKGDDALARRRHPVGRVYDLYRHATHDEPASTMLATTTQMLAITQSMNNVYKDGFGSSEKLSTASIFVQRMTRAPLPFQALEPHTMQVLPHATYEGIKYKIVAKLK